MNLKNYTSSVPASQSILRIEKRLVDMGATSIVKEYDANKKIAGIKFCFAVNATTFSFEMPANVEKVFAVFWKAVRSPNPNTKARLMDQAERTAWKNVAEWVDIQCSLMVMEQVDFMQVFMPYALLPNGKTLYQGFQDSGMKLLGQ